MYLISQIKYEIMGESLEIFETILIFLAVVIVSSFVHTFIPKVLFAFIQIILEHPLYIACTS